MMIKKLTFSAFAIVVAISNAYATDEQQNVNEHLDNNRLSEQRIQSQTQRIPVLEPEVAMQLDKTYQRNDDRLSMSKQELEKYPELVVRALLAAVIQGNIDNVELLFPIYQKIPSQFHDLLLTQWASAILARQNQDFSQAVKLYRQIIAVQPDIPPASLQLAITLFENNELAAAEDQFQKLRSESLPADVQVLISRYLRAIVQRDSWRMGGSLTYLNDPNINNAPNIDEIQLESGVLRAEPKQSAEGVGINVNVGKKWSWGDGFFNNFNLNTSGKYYWNNKKYNEATANVSLGIGYQNGKMLFSVSPFIEQTLYAGGSKDNETLKRFSESTGASIGFNYWLSSKWQLNSAYEYAEQRYDTRKHLDGHYHFVSTGVVYYVDAQRQLYANLNYNQTKAEDKSDSFSRHGATVGWTEVWGKGLSTNLSLSLAKKQYEGAIPLFGVIDRKEYGLQASLWHRALHYRGITPRITYSFNKNDSNHPFYSYDKSRVYISFTKQF